MSYETLAPLIKKTGSHLSPEEFQSVINVIFHNHEARHYDRMHSDMWESLQEQINLLVDDLFKYDSDISDHKKLLDVGCGTGLSTQILLQSQLGKYIDSVTLLDTSPNMLEHAEEKARTWNKHYSIVNDTVDAVNEAFDIIIICSVLHHIPDLTAFLRHIDAILKPGGILIHLQDPNGDYLNDKAYLQRKNEYQSLGSPQRKSIADIIPKNWKHGINRMLGRKNYIDLINDELIETKAISKRMTADEIWSVTDIHVESKFNSVNKGISMGFLKAQLANFNLIKFRSYAFYGVLKSDLPANLEEIEDALIAENQLNGRNISGLWIKKA